MFPQLSTPRLLLTEIELADADEVLGLYSSDRVVEFYDLHPFGSVAQADDLIRRMQQRFADKAGIRWAIRLREEGRLIGTCGFNSWGNRRASVGYDLKESCWGRGIMSEALRAVIQCGFQDSLPCGILNRIEAYTIPGNDRSENLLTRHGFQNEGLLRQYAWFKESYHDMNCFALLKSEHAGPSEGVS